MTTVEKLKGLEKLNNKLEFINYAIRYNCGAHKLSLECAEKIGGVMQALNVKRYDLIYKYASEYNGFLDCLYFSRATHWLDETTYLSLRIKYDTFDFLIEIIKGGE